MTTPRELPKEEVEEVKAVRKKFETETGLKWWTNPVCNGETGFASWTYQGWLETSLRQREKEAERWHSEMLDVSRQLSESQKSLAEADEAIMKKFACDTHNGIACIHCDVPLGLNKEKGEWIHPIPSTCIVLKSQERQKERAGR